MIQGLVSICTGKIPFKDLHGIVAITKIGGNVIENQGIYKGLLLTAIISLNLAIVNFLPIPALDGGHVFFMLLEKITGKKLLECEDSLVPYELITNIDFDNKIITIKDVKGL